MRVHEASSRALVAAVAFTALSLPSACENREERAVRIVTERSCAGTLAFTAIGLNGSSLPAKTLALTFDDGPGARTAELSAYLHTQGIPAAFFVNGKMLGDGTAVLAQLVADGHLIGNHTQTHTSLTGRSTSGFPLAAVAVVDEVAQTDTLIAPFVGDLLLFRAPYGDFDARTAADLEASSMSKYIGPISWDIGAHMGPDQAADWDCWSPSTDGMVLTPRGCGDRYVSEIERVGRGIVLLHDPYFIDGDPAKGGTVDMIEYIVPILKAKGYAFARVDGVPDIAARLPAPDPAPAPAAIADAGTTTPPDPAPPSTATPSTTGPETTRNTGLTDGQRAADPCARYADMRARTP